MADNERLQQQSAAAQEQAKEAAVQETGALCKRCGSALDPDFPFCPSCGEKVGGEEHTCEYCKTKTSKDFCPHCGRRVVPVPCPKCGTLSLYDACENCGTMLNPVLAEMLAMEAPAEVAQMSVAEVEKIKAEFKAQEADESAEFKAFQKKLIERQILLEERDYFNKREKRILKAFGSNPFTLELPDPEEEAFRMKAFAALEKTIIQREQNKIEAELEKLFPPPPDTSAEDAKLAEIEKNRIEMEKKFNEALAKVNSEVDEFRKEEERKRLEEERRRLEELRRQEEERRRQEEERKRQEAERQRQMEIARRRMEEEQRKQRFYGNYFYQSSNVTARLAISGAQATCWYQCRCGHSSTIRYSVNINGDNIKLYGSSKIGESCAFDEYSAVDYFDGATNNAGTMLNGFLGQYFNRMSAVFYKR